MMKTQHITLFMTLLVGSLLLNASCSKQDEWLDVKNKKSDVRPQTLADLQAILDNSQVMNSQYPILGLVSSDNIYIPDANLDATDATSRNAYLWNGDIYQGAIASDWFFAYQVIAYANIVLDGLPGSGAASTDPAFRAIQGAALFYRSLALYQLCQLYCKPYQSLSASADPGVPVRLSSDVNVRFSRGTVETDYRQIISDLQEAATLLPATAPLRTRPTAPAAAALLAKVYLAMGDYPKALAFADQALNTYGTLLDYNTLRTTTANPFPTYAQGNPEVIFYATAYSLSTVTGSAASRSRVAPDLYAVYPAGDLRRTAYYTADGATGNYRFKGSYAAVTNNFCGLATNELYLIRAECLNRAGNLSAAAADLNGLLKNRLTPATFAPYVPADQSALLRRILLERRKELPYTGNLRWEDLRRLNADPQFALTLSRTYRGTVYMLTPQSNRYVLPLPADEITLNNLEQNPR